jgi:membrane protein implicated in regulation of membrane protease activity
MKTTHQIVLTDEYIANAQRLAIAQNTALRLMYQTWWFVWIPRFISLGAGIVFWLLNYSYFIVLFFGLMVALSFLGQYLLRRNLTKARRQFRTKGTTTAVSMDANGIDTNGAFGNSHLKWVAVLKPAIYSNGVLVKISRLLMLWLPDQCLVEGTPAEVRQLLANNVKNPTPES